MIVYYIRCIKLGIQFEILHYIFLNYEFIVGITKCYKVVYLYYKAQLLLGYKCSDIYVY
jgi:hypothetical protein